jgi:hypothetical protein
MSKPEWFAGAGLLATAAVAIYMVVQLGAQSASPSGDFSSATNAEVRDAQGQVVLQGQFMPVEEDDEDIERKAKLTPAGSDQDASGEAEVEISKSAPAKQEIEFSIRNVQSGGVFTFMIDGREVASATADTRGRAEVELDVSAGR